MVQPTISASTAIEHYFCVHSINSPAFIYSVGDLGFLLAGFGLGESFEERETLMTAAIARASCYAMCQISSCAHQSATVRWTLQKELPVSKPRMVAGIGTPLEVVQCVEQGMDLINTAYPTTATELGQALDFSYLIDTPKAPPDQGTV